MTRSIIPSPRYQAKGSAPRDAASDRYNDRLVKYIPAESVVLYQTINSVLASSGMQGQPIHWIIFFVILIANFEYMRKVLSIKMPSQLLISSISFIIWAVSFGQPFLSLSWWQPVYGALILPLFTFIVPIYAPKAKMD
ncbi:hypothetical protein [Celerinatantimonas sp. MCCC 1A17872]|uniref:hypothetical protein n=1 Tax=Celerinatantimonas sp. MCCC 1A17872 TaxID=3177514 RepID=UPI0038BED822